jgi:alkylation response protein AidB-like acyl-CoA dehydrogenase
MRSLRHHAATVAATRSLGVVRCFSGGVTMGLTEEQVSFVELAKNFATSVFDPSAAKWDREHHFPVEELREAAKLGFGAIYTSTDAGGTGLSRLDASLIFEQLSAADASTTAYISIHNMCVWMLDEFASPELKSELIPQLASMEKFASYCLTEPSSGSDAASLKTVAKDCGDYYEVSGSKAFISGAGAADVYVVMVRTGKEGPKGITCLAIDKTMPGVSFGKNELKMGWRSQPTRILALDAVKVPKTRIIGKEGDGFKIAMKGLDGGRINIASCSLGSAQRCLEYATTYSKERKQFTAPLSSFQNTQFKLADMAANVHTSRLMIRDAARALDVKHPETTTLCAMAKMVGTERCYQVVDDALQIHGGYGYLNDFPIERHLRDLRVHRILEGTNEVMRVLVSRAVLKD